MRRYALLIIAVLSFCGLASSQVSAHVLLQDDTGTLGAILHVNPDDDPIAGEESTMFFDVHDEQFVVRSYIMYVFVTLPSGAIEQIPASTAGTTVSLAYTFPERGVYNLAFHAVSPSDTRIFTHSIRVSRGVSGSVLGQPQYEWAEALVVFSVAACMGASAFAYNRRKDIARYSRW